MQIRRRNKLGNEDDSSAQTIRSFQNGGRCSRDTSWLGILCAGSEGLGRDYTLPSTHFLYGCSQALISLVESYAHFCYQACLQPPSDFALYIDTNLPTNYLLRVAVNALVNLVSWTTIVCVMDCNAATKTRQTFEAPQSTPWFFATGMCNKIYLDKTSSPTGDILRYGETVGILGNKIAVNSQRPIFGISLIVSRRPLSSTCPTYYTYLARCFQTRYHQ
jgi:hypothetical protein